MIETPRILTVGLVLLVAQGIAGADHPRPTKTSIKASVAEMAIIPSDQLRWTAPPPVLPPGAQVAVLDGNPATPDRLFTLRIRAPAGYRIMPHWHPADEHVTVISGEVRVGDGRSFDRARMKTLGAGGYFVMPAKHVHYVETTKDTVLQLHGVGRWELHYVNPAHDPRREARPAETARAE